MSFEKTRCALLLTGLLAAVVPLSASAKGDPEAGKAKSGTCQACHGVDGKSIDPTYPNLAGQYASYMEKALKEYRSGERSNMIMMPMAAALTDQDIADIAAWYASQQGLQDLSIK
jgi:cytochrome c553